MTEPYERQRLVHCEDCGAPYAQYVEHEYPICDDCLMGELEDAIHATNEQEALRRQLENDTIRPHHDEQD